MYKTKIFSNTIKALFVGLLAVGVLAGVQISEAPAQDSTQSFNDPNIKDGESLKYSWDAGDVEWEKQYLGVVKRGMQPRYMKTSMKHRVTEGVKYYDLEIEQLQYNGNMFITRSVIQRLDGGGMNGISTVTTETTRKGELAERREFYFKHFFKGYPENTIPMFMTWTYLRGIDFESQKSEKVHMFLDKNITFPIDITPQGSPEEIVVGAGTFRAYRCELMPDLPTFMPTAPRLILTVVQRFLKPINLWFDAIDPSHRLVKVGGKPFPGAPEINIELEEIINRGE